MNTLSHAHIDIGDISDGSLGGFSVSSPPRPLCSHLSLSRPKTQKSWDERQGPETRRAPYNGAEPQPSVLGTARSQRKGVASCPGGAPQRGWCWG